MNDHKSTGLENTDICYQWLSIYIY